MRAQEVDLAGLSLEELTHYDVTTLGRKNASVFETPAPVDVVTGDEIHAMGATTLPEALRLATGVQVSRVDSENYAISIRGFNDATSSKVLVLMDGRSIYDQQYSGTDWANLDLVMGDVSRIEVQRGPAGTLWGANAVNGVINIVSKNAHSTEGTLVDVEAGDELHEAITVRQGFDLSPAAAMRVYAKYQSQGDYDGDTPYGVSSWNSRMAGSRFDWDRPGGGGLSIIGEYHELRTNTDSQLPSILPPNYFIAVPMQARDRTADLSAHWTQPITSNGQLSILAAADHGDEESAASAERHTTANIDSQVTLHPIANHEVIAGATYRTTSDHIHNTPYLTYDTPAATTDFYGAFVQDEITLVPSVFSVTAGSKFERNTFTGWEIQPSLRALWHPTKNQSVWAAVSKAARTPSRAERGVHFFAAAAPPSPALPLPVELIANGDTNFSSEHVVSYELGHRYQFGSVFSVDTSLFYSRYTDLRGLEPSLQPPNFFAIPPYAVLDFDANNSLKGYTYGGELSLHWHPVSTVQVTASAASIHLVLWELNPGAIPDPSTQGLEHNTPPQEYKLHATWHPAPPWTLDAVARHEGEISEAGVPAYNGLDLRVAYLVTSDLEFELVGRDLLKREHPEISGSFLGTTVRPIARSFLLGVTYRH